MDWIRRRGALVAGALFFSGAVAASLPAAAQTPNHMGFAFGTPAGEALLVLGIGLSNAASALPQRATSWGPDAPRPFEPRADLVSDFTGAYGGAAIATLAGTASRGPISRTRARTAAASTRCTGRSSTSSPRPSRAAPWT